MRVKQSKRKGDCRKVLSKRKTRGGAEGRDRLKGKNNGDPE